MLIKFKVLNLKEISFLINKKAIKVLVNNQDQNYWQQQMHKCKDKKILLLKDNQ